MPLGEANSCVVGANQKSQLKTMQPIVEVGQRFKFTVLMDDALTEREGVVTRVLSNREEGLGLDVDQYMSYWVEAHELPETKFQLLSCLFVARTGRYISTAKRPRSPYCRDADW